MAGGNGDAGRPSPARRTAAILTVLTVMGLLFRLPSLSTQPIWLDEAGSFLNARLLMDQGLGEYAKLDHLPPASFLIQGLFIKAFGTSEFTLRLPSALAGAACVPVGFITARQILGHTREALVTGGLFAALPFAIWYSQEARMYSMLMLLAMLFIFTAWPILESELTATRLAACAGITAVGLWIHHYMALIVATFALFAILKLGLRTGRVLRWLSAQSLAVCTFIPWLLLSAQHAARGSGYDKSSPILWIPYTLFTYVTGAMLGPTVPEIRASGMAAIRQDLPGVMAGSLVVLLLTVAAWRLLCAKSLPVQWLYLWLGLPIVLAAGLGLLTGVGFNVRYTAVSFPAFVILCAMLLVRAFRNVLNVGLLVLFAATTIWADLNLYRSPRYQKEDLRSASKAMSRVEPTDTIILANGRARASLEFYGWRCPSRTVTVNNPAEAEIASATIRPSATGPRTWVLYYRQWESDPGQRLNGLQRAQTTRFEGAWPGVSLVSFPGKLNPIPPAYMVLCHTAGPLPPVPKITDWNG